MYLTTRWGVQSEMHDVTRLACTLARANIQNRNPDLFTSRTNSMYIETDGRSRKSRAASTGAKRIKILM